MKNRLKGMVVGLLVGLIFSGTVLASVSVIKKELHYNNIKITLDGNEIKPTGSDGSYVEPFIIDGVTYLPVRGIANALGLGVDWDGNTNTVKLSTSDKSENEDTNSGDNSSDETTGTVQGSENSGQVSFTNKYGSHWRYCQIDGKMYGDRMGFFIAMDTYLYVYDNEYYAEFNPNLYIKGSSDVRVEGTLIELLALVVGSNRISDSDNPYLDGKIDLDLRPYQTIGMEIREENTYTSISNYTTKYSYHFKGKSLYCPDISETVMTTIDGVRFVRENKDSKWLVNVTDFFKYWGINKTITVEKDGDISYISVK